MRKSSLLSTEDQLTNSDKTGDRGGLGLAFNLYESCLKVLALQWRKVKSGMSPHWEAEEEIELSRCLGRLYLWGAGFSEGELEAWLSRLESLQIRALVILHDLGTNLLSGFADAIEVEGKTSLKCNPTQELASLLEKTKPNLAQAAFEADRESSSNTPFLEASKTTRTERDKFLEFIKDRVNLLNELSPTMEDFHIDNERHQKTSPRSTDIEDKQEALQSADTSAGADSEEICQKAFPSNTSGQNLEQLSGPQNSQPSASQARVQISNAVLPCRRAREDEIIVMRAFSTHASRCPRCDDAYRTYRDHGTLCQSGRVKARDIAAYIYNKSGLPLSVLDRQATGDLVQIEIPAGCEAVRRLLKAIDCGLKIERTTGVASQDGTYYVPEEEKATVERKSQVEICESKPRFLESTRSGGFMKYRRERLDTSAVETSHERVLHDDTVHGGPEFWRNTVPIEQPRDDIERPVRIKR